MSKDSFKSLLIAIGITAIITGGGFIISLFIKTWYHPMPTKIELANPKISQIAGDNATSCIIGNTCIEYPYTIKNVSGDNVTGYSLWVETPPLDFNLEKGKPYSFYINTEDIEKAIEEYEKNKTQHNQ